MHVHILDCYELSVSILNLILIWKRVLCGNSDVFMSTCTSCMVHDRRSPSAAFVHITGGEPVSICPRRNPRRTIVVAFMQITLNIFLPQTR